MDNSRQKSPYKTKVDAKLRAALKNQSGAIVLIEPAFKAGTASDPTKNKEQTTDAYNNAAEIVKDLIDRIKMQHTPMMNKNFKVAALGTEAQIRNLAKSPHVKSICALD